MEFKIKEIRIKKKISLYRLSKLTGLSKSYLKDLEDNKKLNPSFSVMCKISLVLNVSIDDLFSLDIEILRNQLYNSINKNGLNAKKNMSISRLLNILINKKY